MSFLSELQHKKSILKPTETIVTTQDGQKYLETSSQIMKLDEISPGFVVDTKPDDIPSKISGNIYLGSQDCCDPAVLDKHNIKRVLSLGVEAPIKSPTVTYKFVKMLDLDRTDLHQYLPECVDYLDCEEKVLVHCNAGVSRSTSIVIAYLILKHNLTFDKAFELVKTARPCARPNDGFMVQLRRLRQV